MWEPLVSAEGAFNTFLKNNKKRRKQKMKKKEEGSTSCVNSYKISSQPLLWSEIFAAVS